jgi:hypothetical protein
MCGDQANSGTHLQSCGVRQGVGAEPLHWGREPLRTVPACIPQGPAREPGRLLDLIKPQLPAAWTPDQEPGFHHLTVDSGCNHYQRARSRFMA